MSKLINKLLDMKKSLVYLFAVSIFSLGLVSCSDDAEMDSVDAMNTQEYATKAKTGEIVQMAYDNGFRTLATALVKTKLSAELDLMGPITLLAPTDEAFEMLLKEIGQSSIDDIPENVLKQILLNHVLAGEAASSEIATIDRISSKAGSTLMLSVNNGFMVGNSNIVEPFDMYAGFGILHTIDQVLIPSSIEPFVNSVLEPAYFNKNFSYLVDAVVKAGLVETLLSTPDLTIFAPTNQAFMEANIDPMALDVETLTKVLTYHVLGAKVMSNEIPREAITLGGSHIYFSNVRSGSFINGNTKITAVDIASGSGVVHVINHILLPAEGTIVDKAIELTATGEFTSLVEALVRTAEEGTPEQNLIAVLNSEGPFSVFAPTNDAFQNLLDSNSNWNSINDIPLETLIDVLTYHVVPARAYDKDLQSALSRFNELPTAQGNPIRIDLNSLSINGTSSIIGVNTHATNGVIHVIDQVLIPLTYSTK